MWNNNPIYKGVMTVVKAKIAEAEDRHKTRCLDIDEKAQAEHEAVDTRAESAKQASIDQEVKAILGKVL